MEQQTAADKIVAELNEFGFVTNVRTYNMSNNIKVEVEEGTGATGLLIVDMRGRGYELKNANFENCRLRFEPED